VFAQSATFEGTVLNRATHTGIPEANVTFWTQKGVRYNAITDASGTFRITGVLPGEYSVRFEKSGFEELDQPGFGQPLLSIGAAGSSHTDAELVPFAILRGRVLDPEGKPVSHVSIELGHHEPAESDAEGLFELEDLHPGTYTLRASPKAGRAGPADGQSAELRRTEIIPTYYPSTADAAEAEHIQIRPGADLAGYEIRLRTSPVYRVGGVVLDESGKPVPKASVRLLGPGEDRLLAGRSMFRSAGGIVQQFLNRRGIQDQEAATTSRDDGTFEFPSVRPGDWTLEAELDPRHDERNNLYLVSSGGVAAPVSDRDLENLELRFAPGFTLEIAADWGGQQPPAGRRTPNVELLPSTPRHVIAAGNKPADEVLRFEHLTPGSYRIFPTPGLPPGFYPSAVLLAGRDVMGQEVELAAGMPPIRVVYKPNPGSIRGSVEQGGGATVLLWPEAIPIPDMVRAVKADSRGSFEVTNVPPGEYSIFAFDRVSNEGGAESFVLGVVAAGTRIKVSEGSAETVQIAVTRWPD
jgi:protocatechuate 3,4-dioxygenase beta subunit